MKFIALFFLILIAGCSDSGAGGGVANGVRGDIPENLFGKVSFWQSDDMESSELVVLDVGSGEYSVFDFPFPVTNTSLDIVGGKVYSARINKLNKNVSVDIFYVHIDTGDLEYVDGRYKSEGLPRLSPNGEWLVFHASRGNEPSRLFVEVVNIETNERQGYECNYERCFDAKWVDDGRLIYVADNNKVVLLDMHTREEVVVYQGSGLEWRVTDLAPRKGGEEFYISRVKGTFRRPQASVVSEVSFKSGSEKILLETKDEILEVSETAIEDTIILTRSEGGVRQFSEFYNTDSGERFVISDENKFSGGASWVD